MRFATDEPADLRERAELLERHGVACANVDRDAATLESSGLALDLWRRIGDADREAALLALRSCYLWRAGRSEDAHASVRAALAMFDPDRPRTPGRRSCSCSPATFSVRSRSAPGPWS